MNLLRALFLLVLSGAAGAHSGHVHSIWDGLVHPYTGLDHVLGLLAMGWWAARGGAQAAGQRLCALGLAFAAGALLPEALPQLAWDALDLLLVLSLCAMAGVLLRAPRRAGFMSYALVLSIAVAHGAAHGVDLAGATLGSLPGLLLGSLLLQACGLGLAHWSARRGSRAAEPLAAGVLALGAAVLAWGLLA